MEICGTDAEWKREMLSLVGHPVDQRIGSREYTRPPRPPEDKAKKKKAKGQPCVLEPKTGERDIRGEGNSVVDGHQTVEHERCFFSYKE